MTKKDRTDYGQYLFIDGDNVSTGSDDEENGCVKKRQHKIQILQG